MRNGVPLHEIRTEIQIEAGLSSEEGATAYGRDRLRQLINRVERQMASENDWPTQKYEIATVIAANTKRHDLPAGVTIKSIRTIHVAFGDQWLPVAKGVGAAERSVYSDTMRASPAMRWDIDADYPGMIEVWPIAAENQTLVFRGQYEVGTMQDENDVCTLDADVIVLRVASQILGRDRQEDAALLLNDARSLTNNILKRLNVNSPPANFSQRARMPLRPGIDFIPSQGS